MTGINQYVKQEDLELGDVVEILVEGAAQTARVLAWHDAEHVVVQPVGGDDLLVVETDDDPLNVLPQVVGGPFAVHAQDDDGELYVRSFRTERAARVFAASQQVA